MGFLRLFLALSVIAGHAGGSVFGFAGVNPLYAVSAFFIISGFYMAMVLNEKYKEISPIVFYKSRLFRLFPTYYIGLVLALVVSFAAIADRFGGLSLGAKFYFVFQNLFIFGQDLSYVFCMKTAAGICGDSVAMTINPPAWSLALELGFYLVAPFILKSETKTYLFFMVGCVYLLLLNGVSFPVKEFSLFDAGFVDLSTAGQVIFNYYFYPSSFMFFGGGALAYHMSKRLQEPNYLVAVGTIFAISFAVTIMPFAHLLFFAMSIPVLFKYTKNNKVDRLVGELSYPVYILHFPILLLFKEYAATHSQYFGFIGMGSWVAVVSCALGLVVYFLVDKKVDSYRHSGRFLSKGSNESAGKSLAVPRALVAVYFLLPVIVLGNVYADQAALKKEPSSTAVNLTDVNWVNGFSRSVAGFFVENKRANLEAYKVGALVRFSNGEVRKVSAVLKAGPYLHVYLEGEAMDGESLGYPEKIQIVD
nr:acyltransferase [Pseudomonas sp. WS 5412]